MFFMAGYQLLPAKVQQFQVWPSHPVLARSLLPLGFGLLQSFNESFDSPVNLAGTV
jgi:hypothetical protein